MGFNKRYIPELEQLKKIKESCSSNEEFLRKVIGKADALMGPVDSMEYLDKIRKEEEIKEAT